RVFRRRGPGGGRVRFPAPCFSTEVPMKSSAPGRLVSGLFLVAFLLAGCGPAKPVAYPISGQLLEKGQPPVVSQQGLPPGDPGVHMTFHLMNEGQQVDAYDAVVNPTDGTYTVPGIDGRGVPPGKYRISVHFGAVGRPDRLREVFSPEKTKIEREI